MFVTRIINEKKKLKQRKRKENIANIDILDKQDHYLAWTLAK